MIHPRPIRRGFTLIEILIVVIILGILAAIVVPQFTNASTDARNSSLSSTLATLRVQIQIYRMQHGDTLPDLTKGWDCLTHKTDRAGNIDPPAGPTFGPYLQTIPVNPLTGAAVPQVADGTAFVPAADYVYDFSNGAGTGRIWVRHQHCQYRRLGKLLIDPARANRDHARPINPTMRMRATPCARLNHPPPGLKRPFHRDQTDCFTFPPAGFPGKLRRWLIAQSPNPANPPSPHWRWA